jgi:nucleotide-binding universal stress UspA family protein
MLPLPDGDQAALPGREHHQHPGGQLELVMSDLRHSKRRGLEGVWMFRKVVVALDGSEEAKSAAALAEAIARRFRSEVLVVHVRELAYTGANTWDPEWAPEVEAFMAAFVDRLTAQGRRARSETPEAPEGHEGHAIGDAAAKMGADLIVMGSKGRSRLAGAVLGSVAGSVIHHASCPVLVTR